MSLPQSRQPFDGRETISKAGERLMIGVLSAGKAYHAATTTIWHSRFEGDLTDPRYTDPAVRRNAQRILEEQNGRRCRSFRIKYIGLSRSEVRAHLRGELQMDESLCYVQIDAVFEPNWFRVLLAYPFAGLFVLVSWIFVFEIVSQRFTTPEFDLRVQSWHRRALQVVPAFLFGFKLLSLGHEKHLRYRRIVVKRDHIAACILPILRNVTTLCHWLESGFLHPQQTFNLPQSALPPAEVPQHGLAQQ